MDSSSPESSHGSVHRDTCCRHCPSTVDSGELHVEAVVISDVGEGVLIVAGGNQRTVHINGRNPIACIGFKVERAAISSGNGDTAAVIGRYRTAIAGANGDVISGVRGITLCELNVNLVVLADIAEGVALLVPTYSLST